MHLSGRLLPPLGTSSRASRAPNSSDIGDCRRDTFGLELSNISAVPRGGDFGEPVRKAFACALASNCTRSAVVTDSDETARRSHAEPPGAVAAKVLGVTNLHQVTGRATGARAASADALRTFTARRLQ